MATEPPASATVPPQALRVEELRRHQTYTGVGQKESVARPQTPNGTLQFPESSYILRKWRNSKGTQRFQFKYLLDFGNGTRLRQTIDSDYFTCRTVEEITVEWRGHSPEYVRIAESLERCPDFTQESSMKEWMAKRADGTPAWPPANHMKTIETSTMKVSVDAKEWAAHGDDAIRDSLSAEFAQVITHDLAMLARVDAFASAACQDVAGLYKSRCDTSPDASLLLEVHDPDCGFDADFGEPCALEDQRAYENRKAHGVLSPTPPPAP